MAFINKIAFRKCGGNNRNRERFKRNNITNFFLTPSFLFSPILSFFLLLIIFFLRPIR